MRKLQTHTNLAILRAPAFQSRREADQLLLLKGRNMFGRIVMLLLLSVSLNAWADEATEPDTAATSNSAAEASGAPNAASGDGAPGANDANISQGATPGKNDPVIDENATDSATCAAKWARFHKSQECFAPYKNRNGSFKPGAFEHCKDYKSPDECSPEDDLMHLPLQQD